MTNGLSNCTHLFIGGFSNSTNRIYIYIYIERTVVANITRALCDRLKKELSIV